MDKEATTATPLVVKHNGNVLDNVKLEDDGNWTVEVSALTLGTHEFAASAGTAGPVSRRLTVESADDIEDFEGCQLGDLGTQSRYIKPYYYDAPKSWMIKDDEQIFTPSEKFKGNYVFGNGRVSAGRCPNQLPTLHFRCKLHIRKPSPCKLNTSTLILSRGSLIWKANSTRGNW